jgi:hypothetical protein
MLNGSPHVRTDGPLGPRPDSTKIRAFGGEWLLSRRDRLMSRRDRLIVARYEVPG